MKLERSKNTKRNISVGLVNRIVTLLLPFIVRTVFIRTLGAEYLGLRGVFSSILQVLSLAELGFGSTMVFNMYNAIAEDNDELICALMHLYRKIYRYIGLAILLISAILIPFIPHFIHGEYPSDINLYVVYCMYIVDSVLSYWMFAYKASILHAFQREDLCGAVNMFISIITNLLKIGVLLLLGSFYLYLSIQILSTILTNVVLSLIVDRKYPQYKCHGNVPKYVLETTKTKMKGLLLYKFCGVTRNSLDSVFISMFLGLVVTGIYNNYYYVITIVMSFLSIITSSMLAGIGNSIASEEKEKNIQDFKKLDFLYMLISGLCTTCLVCLYQPFMSLWAGEDLMFSFDMAILFSLYFYILCMGNIRTLYADAAGLWWEDRYRNIIESATNICLNYLLLKAWGVYGIIIATIISLLFIGWPGASAVFFKAYYKPGLKKYIISHLAYLGVTVVVCSFTLAVCSLFKGQNWLVLLVRGLICCTVAPLIYYMIYKGKPIFEESKRWLLTIIWR